MDKIEVGEVFSISEQDGVEQDVEVLGIINLEAKEYVAVAFVEDIQNQEDEEDLDIFFLRIDSEGEFDAIESDEEFEKVSAAFDDFFNQQE